MNRKTVEDRAITFFNAGYNCAQSTFASIAPAYGLSEQDALRITGAFGGGIAGYQGICGALSGALMALSLKDGSTETSPEQKAAMRVQARSLMAEFEKRCGAQDCRTITDCDMSTEEGKALALARDVRGTVCAKAIKTAIALVMGS